MEKLTAFFKKHIISIVGAAIVLSIIAFFSIQSGCETKEFNQTVDKHRNQANKAVQEAANAQNQATNTSIERRTEDTIREKTITPKLDGARRRSQNSKAELEAARKTYNEQKSNTSNLSRLPADNCIDLGSLFPDVRFEDCH